MAILLADKFEDTFIAQIIQHSPEPFKITDRVIVECKCGVRTEIGIRPLYRRWGGSNEYLCKSCHVKTYANNQQKLKKFRASFAKTAKTPGHKKKCSEAAKKLWATPELRKKVTEAVRRDNITNPKKAVARQIALTKLCNKNWFDHHMTKMRNLAIAITSSTTDEFISKAINIHGDRYDYSKVIYINSNMHVIIACRTHGEFLQTPHGHLQGKGCKKCNIIISNPHQLVLDMLGGIKLENNTRTIIPPKEIDIWIPEHKLGIEIHGEYWHGVRLRMTKDERKRAKWQHACKANAAKDAGIKLYQLWAREILNKTELIKSMLRHSCGLSNKIYARKCEISSVKNNEISCFYDASHLQGSRNSFVNCVLTYEGEIACGLSLSRNFKHGWEIIRYACKNHTTVVGGFSRLFKRFIDEHKPSTVMTFADRRISTGNLYYNWFDLVGTTNPNYFYFDKKNGTVLSRQRCQKHKLKTVIGDCFNPTKTEVENMLSAGYIQVFDAGHLKFIWPKQN